MAGKCSVCKEAAHAICECNGLHFCKKDLEKHTRKRGEHKVVIIEAPKKQVSFELENESLDKSLTIQPPQAKGQDAIRDYFLSEKVRLQRFQENVRLCLDEERTRCIGLVISAVKKSSREFLAEIDEAETKLQDALSLLEKSTKIPTSNSIIQKAKEIRSKKEGTLINIEAQIDQRNPEFTELAAINLEWNPNPQIEMLRAFYNQNKDNIPPKLAELFSKIFAEKHYMLKKLDLGKSKLKKNDMLYLNRIFQLLPQIEQLKLSGNNIGPEGAEVLGSALLKLPEIKKLFLASVDLKGKGIEFIGPALIALKQIDTLILSKNGLGATGARNLSAILPDMPVLKELNLDNNSIGTEGSRALCSAFPKCMALQNLCLRANGLGDDSVKFLKASLGRMNQLVSLKLEKNNMSNDDKRTLQSIVRPGCKIDF